MVDFSRIVIIKDSLTIDKLAYDWETRTLRVWFVSTGSVWDYHDVYPADFAKLTAASSVGEVFNARFRNRYECTRVEPEEKKKASATVLSNDTTST